MKGTRVRKADGGNLARLREIKACYDPTNLLQVTRNIPPWTSGDA